MTFAQVVNANTANNKYSTKCEKWSAKYKKSINCSQSQRALAQKVSLCWKEKEEIKYTKYPS